MSMATSTIANMSEVDEIYEAFESVVHDLIKEYENRGEYYDSDIYWNLGAIEALEELLRRLNEG